MKKNRGNKRRHKIRKRMKSLKKCATRKPIAPPTIVFKDKKKYSRKENKKIIRDCKTDQ